MQLYFDFTKGARRADILEQVKAKLDDASWAAITIEAAKAGVPKGHRIKEDMLAVYEILAKAEAQVHGCEVDETHFHEVGNGEAILNTLIICSAINYLHPDFISASPVQTGSGQIECAHGLMDIPAPATAAILSTGIPTCEEKLEGELCTPTSAALIKHFVQEFRTF